MKRPNVILIITDDQGYGNLSCHGNPYLHTPNIDDFCYQNTSFQNFQVSPSCAPTRASLMTGRHEFLCGVSHVKKGRSILNSDNYTIPEVLSENGYKTGIFGKWHLGENYPSRACDRGFQETFTFGDSCISSSGDYWGNTKFSPTIKHNGKFEKTNGYSTQVFFDQAFKWITEVSDSPFFAYISTCVPHGPYNAPMENKKKFIDMGLPDDVSNYYGMIEKLDEVMGGFLEQIKKSGLDEDTLIIFMSDNGSVFPEIYNAGLRGGKTNTWEGGTRVPLFMRYPGKTKAGFKIDTLAGAKDIFPTILDSCGIPVKEEYKFEGETLLPLMESKPLKNEDRLIFTHLGFWNSDENIQDSKLLRASVRSQNYRYVNEAQIDNVFSNLRILNPNEMTPENWELHDMIYDKAETIDIKRALPQISSQMENAYDRWWDSVYDVLDYKAHIIIGSEIEPISHLSCYDWYPSMDFPGRTDCSVGMQSTIQKVVDYLNNGTETPIIYDLLIGEWNVETHRQGKYKIEIRLLPIEAGEIVKLKPGKAYLKFNGKKYEKEIDTSISHVVFEEELDKCCGQLECWFGNQLPNNKVLGAFNVYVEYTER